MMLRAARANKADITRLRPVERQIGGYGRWNTDKKAFDSVHIGRSAAAV